MQTSRVNGLTSGVFAFLVPASCLDQKGKTPAAIISHTLLLTITSISLFLLQRYQEQGKLAFPRFLGWPTEQREGVSYFSLKIILRIFLLQLDSALYYLTYDQTSL